MLPPFYTSVAVEFFVENKALALGFVLPKIWNVCVDMMRLAILQTRHCCNPHRPKPLPFQAVFFEICDGLVMISPKWHCLCCPIVGASSRYDMVRIVNGQLPRIV
ncbi:MAG: hypothetical protein IPQ28_14395 [Sphingobacteriales bacterium]|nr:hypothetical protein [Sphingobacteriales bacterium]